MLKSDHFDPKKYHFENKIDIMTMATIFDKADCVSLKKFNEMRYC